MHVAYALDPITKKLAAFELPDEFDVESSEEVKSIQESVKCELNAARCLILVDAVKKEQTTTGEENEPKSA